MPASNQPEKEKLPAFKTAEECIAYCYDNGDDFYFTAFMLEAWLGMIITKAVQQYAEHKSGDRQARRVAPANEIQEKIVSVRR